MYGDYKPTKNICDYHADIESASKEILHIKVSDYDNPEDMLWKIQSLADDIFVASQYAYVAGNNMESRLREYRDSIESLGFKRNIAS